MTNYVCMYVCRLDYIGYVCMYDFCGALTRNAKISFIIDILFSLQAIALLNASIASVVLISAVVTMLCS